MMPVASWCALPLSTPSVANMAQTVQHGSMQIAHQQQCRDTPTTAREGETEIKSSMRPLEFTLQSVSSNAIQVAQHGLVQAAII